METLHDLLVDLLKHFDPGAVKPFFKGAAVGLMVPPPSFEAWTLRLDGDQIALVEGLEPAEIIIQAPLSTFRAALVPGGEWDIQRTAHIVGIATPGDPAVIQRVLDAFHITTHLPGSTCGAPPSRSSSGCRCATPPGRTRLGTRPVRSRRCPPTIHPACPR